MGGRKDDELMAVLLFAVSDDAYRIYRRVHLRGDHELQADAAFAFDQKGAGLRTALAE